MNAQSSRWSSRLILLAACLLLPCSAFAHTEEGAAGFMAGLKHPVFGLDHLLAMVSVGVVSSLLGGINIWRIPGAFVTAMIFGGVAGAYQIPMPHAELAIAASVLLLGIGIALTDQKTSPLLVTVCVIFFGFFHGHAHGMEMPRAAEPAYYTFGFVVSTSLLHVVGVIIGELAIHREKMVKALRFAGYAIAACGMFFILQSTGTV